MAGGGFLGGQRRDIARSRYRDVARRAAANPARLDQHRSVNWSTALLNEPQQTWLTSSSNVATERLVSISDDLEQLPKIVSRKQKRLKLGVRLGRHTPNGGLLRRPWEVARGATFYRFAMPIRLAHDVGSLRRHLRI
jgi:hypothetical protein